jgi:hypothetical protein
MEDPMALRAELTEQPGFHDLLSRDEPVSNNELRPALEAFLATPGIAGTPVQEALDEVTRPRPAAVESLSSWWDGVHHWLWGQRVDVIDTEDRAVELAAYWLTLPAVADAKVTVTSSVTSSDETSASFTVLGIGGGPTFTVDIKEDVSFPATKMEQVVLSAIGSFEKVQITKDGAVVATYPRLRALDRDNLTWTRTPFAPPDPGSWGTPTRTRRFDVTASNDITKNALTVTKGTAWEGGAELSLKKLGLAAKVGTKVTYEREVAFEYELPGGHDYLASLYPTFPAYLWTT